MIIEYIINAHLCVGMSTTDPLHGCSTACQRHMQEVCVHWRERRMLRGALDWCKWVTWFDILKSHNCRTGMTCMTFVAHVYAIWQPEKSDGKSVLLLLLHSVWFDHWALLKDLVHGMRIYHRMFFFFCEKIYMETVKTSDKLTHNLRNRYCRPTKRNQWYQYSWHPVVSVLHFRAGI